MVMESVRDGSSWHRARSWSNRFYTPHMAEVALHLSALDTNGPHTLQLTPFRYSLLAESFMARVKFISTIFNKQISVICFIDVGIFCKDI